MPHQGFITLCISFLSICLTMSIIFYTLRHEKSQQAQNNEELYVLEFKNGQVSDIVKAQNKKDEN